MLTDPEAQWQEEGIIYVWMSAFGEKKHTERELQQIQSFFPNWATWIFPFQKSDLVEHARISFFLIIFLFFNICLDNVLCWQPA